jgi:predicted metal-dependent phosphoesterase TrpH
MDVRFETPDIDRLRREHMLVDMHFHTRYSHDSSTQIDTILRKARELQVQLAITDHNTVQGILLAAKAAPGIVRPGIEICTKENREVISYFYTVEELEAFFRRVVQPHVKRKTSLQTISTGIRMDELLDELSRENCVVALPHPFAMRPRRSFSFFDAPKRRHLLRHVHAVEVLNASMIHRHNLASLGWAVKHRKAFVGGTDGHTIQPLGSVFTCSTAQTWEEFLDDVKAKRAFVVGSEHKLSRKFFNATRILREKTRILKNFRQNRK